jgi:hypothetical protein
LLLLFDHQQQHHLSVSSRNFDDQEHAQLFQPR